MRRRANASRVHLEQKAAINRSKPRLVLFPNPATGASTRQCTYSSVSKASLQKTGVFLDSTGDFWESSTQEVRTSVSRDYCRREKPAFGGPFSSKEGNSLKRGLVGWGGRIRTSAWWNQNPLPYHLATPQKPPGKRRDWRPPDSPAATPVYRGS